MHRIKMLTALEPNAFQVFSSQGALRLPVALEPENDIVQNRFPRQQARFLKDEPCRAFNAVRRDRKSTRLNSSHVAISYAVFCLKKKKKPKCIHDDITSYNTKRT